MEKIYVLGVPVHKINMNEALDKSIEFLNSDEKRVIFTPNSEIVMMAKDDKHLLSVIEGADLVIPDGIGLVLASRIIKKPLEERVTGIDLMENILDYCNKAKKSIFILGGKPGVADKALKNISKKYPNIKALGSYHGYFKGYHIGCEGHDEEKSVIDLINNLKPDVLFVAFGAPRQEFWIRRYKDEINANIFMGVGGSVDVYAGEVKRAPVIYQKLGLEWFYRLIKEPWRYKRMMALPKFVIEVLKSVKK
ncbi:WecB/TagA/CpsF family glycosyltransferase [Tepidibacter thalassicus]|uniref:N-acetylglucosaminyldiphosphoundecaprenol N-acetyl-beta-D-mannosaminyltransferase n=1 Tax=Tepidibacter thalassicus DSM 15285 TaxID=1123350 RepID=A0A1M5TD50_9FIRM|nr:WecB/TagA/CpsF family glycosyltransferase [Tepidibacter thalassicus]SHH48648.1 N-acetylglucosaminyldiphosphoundecaprenol N-acetyl-beta-D-mannosaminyltransferase [Tepidibacter thalassicus DSM 15285]